MELSPEEENQLVEKAKLDPEAFADIFDLYYVKIFNYCIRRVQNKTLAEDLTSEIFFKALKNLSKFKWQSVPFGAWLFRIASNEVITYYRKGHENVASLDQMQQETGFDVEGVGDAATDIKSEEVEQEQFALFHEVSSCLISLPEHYREVISLRYFEKLSILEISEILEKPEGTVKSLLSRGVEMLRKQMSIKQPVLAPNVVISVRK